MKDTIKRNKLLALRLQEVLHSGKWIANTNYKKQIETTSWKQAIHKIGNLNSIAALTFHVNYYLSGIINVFEGGKLEIQDKFSFEMPPIKSESDWKNLIDDFIKNSEKFILHVENIRDEQLDENFVDVKYGTYLRNIEGVIEHSYYHLGQISLIKKMIAEKNTL